MSTNVLKENDVFIAELRNALREGEVGLRHVPDLLKCVIEKDRWRERVIQQTGEIIQFERFDEFIITDPPEGLGATMDLIWRICKGHEEVEVLLDKITNKRPGGVNNPSGIGGWSNKTDDDSVLVNIDIVNIDKNCKQSESNTGGNSRQYALRRLRKTRPDLLERVVANELSPHAAMVEAGLRKQRASFILTPESVADTLINKFDDGELSTIVELLVNHLHGRRNEH